MGYVLGLVLVAGVMAFIGWPLLRREAGGADEALEVAQAAPQSAAEEERAGRKEQVLAALNELEYDFHMRKIAPEDYRVLKARLIDEAAAVLGRGGEHGQAGWEALESAIEAEVAAELEKESSTSEGRAAS